MYIYSGNPSEREAPRFRDRLDYLDTQINPKRSRREANDSYPRFVLDRQKVTGSLQIALRRHCKSPMHILRHSKFNKWYKYATSKICDISNGINMRQVKRDKGSTCESALTRGFGGAWRRPARAESFRAGGRCGQRRTAAAGDTGREEWVASAYRTTRGRRRSDMPSSDTRRWRNGGLCAAVEKRGRQGAAPADQHGAQRWRNGGGKV
jgi:hypothetical protein